MHGFWLQRMIEALLVIGFLESAAVLRGPEGLAFSLQCVLSDIF
jgi:hypothetical protein